MKIIRLILLGVFCAQVSPTFSMPIPDFIEMAATATRVVRGTIQLLEATQEVRATWDQLKKQFPAAATKGINGDPWIVEKSNGGAVFERLGQLQEEGLLRVNKEIRAQDNLNRVAHQINDLQDVLKNEQNVNAQLANALEQVSGCIRRNSELSLGTEKTNEKSALPVVVGKGYSIQRSRADECLLPFFESANVILKTEKTNTVVTLPEKQTSNLSETAGSWEWRAGLRASHYKIKELFDQGIDVQYGVRIRDNFNRMRNQVIGLHSSINDQIKEKSKQKSTVWCLANVWDSILNRAGPPSTPIERDLFMNCYKSDNPTSTK